MAHGQITGLTIGGAGAGAAAGPIGAGVGALVGLGAGEALQFFGQKKKKTVATPFLSGIPTWLPTVALLAGAGILLLLLYKRGIL